jgi:hypothetical protein
MGLVDEEVWGIGPADCVVTAWRLGISLGPEVARAGPEGTGAIAIGMGDAVCTQEFVVGEVCVISGIFEFSEFSWFEEVTGSSPGDCVLLVW